MVLYGIAMIFGWSIGIGAQAVSRKTPIYFIIYNLLFVIIYLLLFIIYYFLLIFILTNT